MYMNESIDCSDTDGEAAALRSSRSMTPSIATFGWPKLLTSLVPHLVAHSIFSRTLQNPLFIPSIFSFHDASFDLSHAGLCVIPHTYATNGCLSAFQRLPSLPLRRRDRHYPSRGLDALSSSWFPAHISDYYSDSVCAYASNPPTCAIMSQTTTSATPPKSKSCPRE